MPRSRSLTRLPAVRGRFAGAQESFVLERSHVLTPNPDGTHDIFGSFQGSIPPERNVLRAVITEAISACLRSAGESAVAQQQALPRDLSLRRYSGLSLAPYGSEPLGCIVASGEKCRPDRQRLPASADPTLPNLLVAPTRRETARRIGLFQ